MAAPPGVFVINAASPSPTVTPSPTATPSPVHTLPTVHVAHVAGGIAWSTVLPNWIGVFATVGLLVGAFFTAKYAKQAFGKQSDQLRDQQAINAKLRAVADLQVKDLQGSLDERQQDREERRRAQATQIYVVIDQVSRAGGEVRAASNSTNASTQPIYDIVAQWGTRFGPVGDPMMHPQLVPGESTSFIQLWQSEDLTSNLSIQIEFRDAAGVYWRTTDRGELTEFCGSPQPRPSSTRCTFGPGHDGGHSWEAPPSPDAAPPR
jgi:hypothetical protein